MLILGVSAFYHDSAAALVRDGEIVAAAQEERFSRRKHDARFPAHAIRYCLAEAGIEPETLDHVVFYEKPCLKFERLLETSTAFAPSGFASFAAALPIWLNEKLFQESMLVNELRRACPSDAGEKWEERLLFSEHHLSHAASAFFPSSGFSPRRETRAARDQPALSCILRTVCRAHRLPGARQHSFNVRGEPIVSTPERLPLLHGHRARYPRRRQLLPDKIRAGPVVTQPLRTDVRARLRCRHLDIA